MPGKAPTIEPPHQFDASAVIELQTVSLNAPQSPSEEETDEGKTGLTTNTILKLIAASFGYFFAGTNDGSLGALTPYIIRTYAIGTQHIALMYVSSYIC